MLPVLPQHVIGFTAAEEVSGGLLHAVVLTPPVADGAGMDSWRRRTEGGGSVNGTAKGQAKEWRRGDGGER